MGGLGYHSQKPSELSRIHAAKEARGPPIRSGRKQGAKEGALPGVPSARVAFPPLRCGSPGPPGGGLRASLLVPGPGPSAPGRVLWAQVWKVPEVMSPAEDP